MVVPGDSQVAPAPSDQKHRPLRRNPHGDQDSCHHRRSRRRRRCACVRRAPAWPARPPEPPPLPRQPAATATARCGRAGWDARHPVTGEAADQVKAAIAEKYPDATVQVVEEEDDGYEAHITKADGTPSTSPSTATSPSPANTPTPAGMRGPGGMHGTPSPAKQPTRSKQRSPRSTPTPPSRWSKKKATAAKPTSPKADGTPRPRHPRQQLRHHRRTHRTPAGIKGPAACTTRSNSPARPHARSRQPRSRRSQRHDHPGREGSGRRVRGACHQEERQRGRGHGQQEIQGDRG